MNIVIKGKPIAKKRPRFARVGKFSKTYNDQETEESRWLWEAQQQIDEPPLQGAVELFINFHFKRPKGHFGTGRNAGKLKPSAPAEHIIKPDTDNLIKFALDCLNLVAFEDDSQIVIIHAAKLYAGENGAMTSMYLKRII